MALSRYIPLHLDTEPECPIRRTGPKGAGTTFECEETLFLQPGFSLFFFFLPGPVGSGPSLSVFAFGGVSGCHFTRVFWGELPTVQPLVAAVLCVDDGGS